MAHPCNDTSSISERVDRNISETGVTEKHASYENGEKTSAVRSPRAADRAQPVIATPQAIDTNDYRSAVFSTPTTSANPPFTGPAPFWE